MDKLKHAVISSATESVFEDLDRLPQADREAYLRHNERLISFAATMEGCEVGELRRFDIDALIELQRSLTRSLYKRDQLWFSHFRD